MDWHHYDSATAQLITEAMSAAQGELSLPRSHAGSTLTSVTLPRPSRYPATLKLSEEMHGASKEGKVSSHGAGRAHEARRAARSGRGAELEETTPAQAKAVSTGVILLASTTQAGELESDPS